MNPFEKLLPFLENEKDQNEYLRVVADLELGKSDVELSKFLLVLQQYKAYYSTIPGLMKSVLNEALGEIQRLREEIEALADRTSADAAKISRWAEEMHRTLHEAEPSKIAAIVHKRLSDDTVKTLAGSLQALKTASAQVDTATQKMNAAAYQAAVAVHQWQTLSLRRVWASAFCFSVILTFVVLAGIWIFYLRS